MVSLFDPTPVDEPVYPRFMEIAFAAVERGHRVKHFTSTFRHVLKSHRSKKSFVHKESEFYSVHYIKSMGYKSNYAPRRFYAHYDFARRLLKEFNSHTAPDIIFISMPPLSTVFTVSIWCKKRGIPIVVDIIDPWPDSFLKDVPKRIKPIIRPLLNPFYWKLKSTFKNSKAITAISNDYLKWAIQFHSADKLTRSFFLAINVDEVHEVTKRFQKSSEVNGKLRLIYAGSMASSYDIPCILDAARAINLKYPGKTEFVFTGKGPQLGLIEKDSRRFENIKYLGWLTKEELIEEYAKSDIGLIQHKNSLTQTITYKFFNYMSAGLVLLNSLQTEMASMIEKNSLGKNNNEMDSDGLIRNIVYYLENPDILREHQKNVIDFTFKNGHTNTVYANLVEFLERLANIKGN